MDKGTDIHTGRTLRIPSQRPRKSASKRRTQSERTAETTQKLIQAAIDLVCENGYANVTTAKIAARAEVSRGALQHHFRSRTELVIAVAEHLTKNMLRLGEKLGGRNLSLEGRIEAAVTHYISTYLHRDYFATLNIMVGIMNDPEFSDRSRLVNIQKGSDAPWLSLFADQGIDEKDLLMARNITLSTLRGMAMARHLGMTTGAIKPELEALKAMLLRFLREKKRASAASSARKGAAPRKPTPRRRG